MGYLSIFVNRASHAISEILPLRGCRRAANVAGKADDILHCTNSIKQDEFVHCAADAVPKKLQDVFDTLDNCSTKRDFYKKLYSIDQGKFDFISNHPNFKSGFPYFNDEAFLKAVSIMPEKELRQTFDEISELYKTLPEVSYDYDKVTKKLIYQPQVPYGCNLAQLTILKAHNKEAYYYLINHPDKETLSHLLGNFESYFNGSTFETLTVPQIRQIEGVGSVSSLNRLNSEDLMIMRRGGAAEGRFVESSDMFYQNPEDVQNLHNYLSRTTITEPFTVFRAERDTGMFSSVALDKSMTRKVKFLALKNMFKARKIKVHDYAGTYQNFKHTDLFSHIMSTKQLTLADAMQVAKYGDDNFRRQLIELIKSSKIDDNRFKSLTFDGGFAREWAVTQDGHTKILHNMSIDKGLHGKCSGSSNRQAEFILNNDPKVISFQDVKYDPELDVFYFDSSITPA